MSDLIDLTLSSDQDQPMPMAAPQARRQQQWQRQPGRFGPPTGVLRPLAGQPGPQQSPRQSPQQRRRRLKRESDKRYRDNRKRAKERQARQARQARQREQSLHPPLLSGDQGHPANITAAIQPRFPVLQAQDAGDFAGLGGAVPAESQESQESRKERRLRLRRERDRANRLKKRRARQAGLDGQGGQTGQIGQIGQIGQARLASGGPRLAADDDPLVRELLEHWGAASPPDQSPQQRSRRLKRQRDARYRKGKREREKQQRLPQPTVAKGFGRRFQSPQIQPDPNVVRALGRRGGGTRQAYARLAYKRQYPGSSTESDDPASPVGRNFLGDSSDQEGGNLSDFIDDEGLSHDAYDGHDAAPGEGVEGAAEIERVLGDLNGVSFGAFKREIRDPDPDTGEPYSKDALRELLEYANTHRHLLESRRREYIDHRIDSFKTQRPRQLTGSEYRRAGNAITKHRKLLLKDAQRRAQERLGQQLPPDMTDQQWRQWKARTHDMWKSSPTQLSTIDSDDDADDVNDVLADLYGGTPRRARPAPQQRPKKKKKKKTIVPTNLGRDYQRPARPFGQFGDGDEQFPDV